MSENKLTLTLIASLTIVTVVIMAFIFYAALLLYVLIGLGSLTLLALIGVAWRKWQHSRLPVSQDRREQRDMQHRHELDRAEDRRRQEAHEQELLIASQRWQMEQHLLLTRIAPDPKGYYPYLVTQEGGYQHLPNPHLRLKEIEAPAEVPLLSGSAAAGQLPTMVRYEDVRSQVPRGHTLLGIDGQQAPVTREYSVLSTCWIVGGSKTGKTNTVALKVQEAYEMGSRFLLVDPHAFKQDSLYNSIKGYAGRFLMPMAQEVEEILPVLKAFVAEFERRKHTGHCPSPLTLLVDEVGSLVSDKPETEEEEEVITLLKKIARICGQEARGFDMYGMFISQDAAGLAWLRKRAMTVIAHKVLMMSERQLVCNGNGELARSMDTWPIGRVLVYGLAIQEMMILQQPVFSPRRVVDAGPTPATRTGPLREQKAFPHLPQSAGSGKREDTGRRSEGPQEAAGRSMSTDDLNNPLVLKKFLNEAGKMREKGLSIDGILKEFGLPPGGRNNQNLKMLLDVQQQEREA